VNGVLDVNFSMRFYFLLDLNNKLFSMNFITFTILLTIFGCKDVSDQSNSSIDPSIVFAGTTPCGNIIRPLHKISPEPDCALEECQCIMVEWELTLYTDASTKNPARYKLKGINRHVVKETNMYSEPGVKTETEGRWEIVPGTKTNPGAIYYQLDPDKPGISLRFLKLSDNLLHIVDQNEKLMIGNEFFSYTLNRVSN
jgi:hypothetical protein